MSGERSNEEGAAARQDDRSVGSLNPNNLPLAQLALQDDQRPWRQFKLVAHDHRELPPAVMDLFMVQYFDSSISRIAYVSTLANLCMIETGFIPTFGNQPNLSATEIMELPLPKRMNMMIDILKSLYSYSRTSVVDVYYKYIMAGQPDQRVSYVYGDSLLKLTVFHNTDTIVHLEGAGHSITFQTHMIGRYVATLLNFQRLTLEHMMHEFRSTEFVYDMKCTICGPIIEALNCTSTEVMGFRNLPVEIVDHLVAFLDFRSFVNLILTSSELNHTLDTEPMWENLCRRIPLDFPSYSLPVPNRDTLRILMADPAQTFKQKYRAMYEQSLVRRRLADQQANELRPRFWLDI